MLTSSSSKKWSVEIHCALLARSSVCRYQSPMVSVNLMSKWRRFGSYMQSLSRGQSQGCQWRRSLSNTRQIIVEMMDDSTEQKNDTGDADHKFQAPYSNITQRCSWELYQTNHKFEFILKFGFNRKQVLTSNLRQELFKCVCCLYYSYTFWIMDYRRKLQWYKLRSIEAYLVVFEDSIVFWVWQLASPHFSQIQIVILEFDNCSLWHPCQEHEHVLVLLMVRQRKYSETNVLIHSCSKCMAD